MKTEVQKLYQDSQSESERIKKFLKESGLYQISQKESHQPSFQLDNRWRRLAPLKSLLLPVNLGIYDRSHFSKD